MRRISLAAAFILPVLAWPGAAVASDEARQGAVLAESCTNCHGVNGLSDASEIPHLAGQHADYMVVAMKKYREGSRGGVSMKATATGLSDEEIVQVTAYFASLTPFNRTNGAGRDANATPAAGDPRRDPFAAAREATEDCAACHGEDGNAEFPGMPRLAGQHVRSLAAALQAYRDGSRVHEEMNVFAEPLGDGDIEFMARYYASAIPARLAWPETGNLIAGEVAAEACASCHGPYGDSSDHASPRLAGQDAEYLLAALEAYRDDAREHAAMQEIAGRLSETEIVNLAAFYASQEPKALTRRQWLTAGEWAARCDRCHGPDGNSMDPRFPILAGQSEEYIYRALKVYHGETRGSSIMQAMSFPLGEADFRNLAAYYSAKREK